MMGASKIAGPCVYHMAASIICRIHDSSASTWVPAVQSGSCSAFASVGSKSEEKLPLRLVVVLSISQATHQHPPPWSHGPSAGRGVGGGKGLSFQHVVVVVVVTVVVVCPVPPSGQMAASVSGRGGSGKRCGARRRCLETLPGGDAVKFKRKGTLLLPEKTGVGRGASWRVSRLPSPSRRASPARAASSLTFSSSAPAV